MKICFVVLIAWFIKTAGLRNLDSNREDVFFAELMIFDAIHRMRFFLSNTWENMTKIIKCIIQAHSNSWQTFSHSCQREVSLKRCRWTWRDHEKETTASRNARSKLRRTQRNTAKELPGWLRMRGHPSYWGKRTVSRVTIPSAEGSPTCSLATTRWHYWRQRCPPHTC